MRLFALVLFLILFTACGDSPEPFGGRRITCLFTAIDSNPNHYPIQIYLGEQQLGQIKTQSDPEETCLDILNENAYTVLTTERAVRAILPAGKYKFGFKNNLGNSGYWVEQEITSHFRCFTVTD